VKLAARLRDAIPAGDAGPEWVDPISIDVPEGSWSVIRTTPERSHLLMRLLVGAAAAKAGEVTLMESSVASWSRTERRQRLSTIGVLLDPPGLSSALTLSENLAIPSTYRGLMARDGADAAAATLLDELDIGAYAGRRPPNVPEDARQLAALGRALLGRPALLLLENPLSAVKSRAAGAVWARCRRLVPSALVTTFHRDETLYAVADALYLWDATGMRRAASEAIA
jgi:ABC-type multidrug transport system ATPase subunit